MKKNDYALDLFMEHPLCGLRICLAGTFTMPSQSLNKRLRQIGVEQIDRVMTVSTENNSSTPPVKESTQLFVVGQNAPEDSIKRYELNCHDGYNAIMITEQQLYALMRGEISMEIPKTIVKHVELTYSYYDWSTPTFSGHTLTTRRSSPVKYDMHSVLSPVAGKEIYVPEMNGKNMSALRQIIGNLGGFANTYYDDKTEIVLLSDQTIEQWKNGIKDHVIQDLENKYNNGNNKIFNIQFSCESDFIEWVRFRLQQCPDISSIHLLKQLNG